MNQEDSPFWVDVTLEDEEMGKRLWSAIGACKIVHEWAMVEMRSLWTDSEDRRIGYNDLVIRMTKQAGKLGIRNLAQRFSLVTALSRAVGRFNQEMQVEMVTASKATVLFPNPYMPEKYKMLDVQSRAVWRVYMNRYSRFSTHYGGIYLDNEDGGYRWRVLLAEQAKKEGILPELAPYLVYSASIREREGNWEAHFNFHQPASVNGKKRLGRA